MDVDYMEDQDKLLQGKDLDLKIKKIHTYLPT